MTHAEARTLSWRLADHPDTDSDWTALGMHRQADDSYLVVVRDRFADATGAHRQYSLTDPRQWDAHRRALATDPAVRAVTALLTRSAR